MKKIMIFGSTGSIGKSTLDIIRGARDEFMVVGLCAYRDIETLTAQIEEFHPRTVCVVEEQQAASLTKRVDKSVTVLGGEQGLEEFSHMESDLSLMAITGISCLKPLLINMHHTSRIALANKESVVTAGSFIFDEARVHHKEIIPVDSEINALFQLLRGREVPLRGVVLTASGGALIDYTESELAEVGIKEVLSHPTWNMGKRVTVDSATLVNKGFEVLETHFFFDIPYEKIDVVVHRESTIHALVEFQDRSMIASLYPPDMRVPIAFALFYPHRQGYTCGLDFRQPFSLSFEPLNEVKYPLFTIMVEAAKKKDNAVVILNACDEVCVEYFLKEKIQFHHIQKAMNYMFEHYPEAALNSADDVFYWDAWGRKKTEEYLSKLYSGRVL